MNLIIKESIIVRRTYETASWFTDIKLEPGTYEMKKMVKTNFDTGKERDTWGITVPGVVVASRFVNRLFHVSNTKIDEDVGQEDSWGFHFDPECYYSKSKILYDGKVLISEKGGEK